jgi:thiamine kinase-like enzyme
MSEAYLGTLQRVDPLYDYLSRDVLPQADLDVKDPVFHVCRLSGSNMVYKYREERSNHSVIGKFYGSQEPYKADRLINEFDNLRKARALGLTELPNYVVKPLGQDKSMGLGLMEEYVQGKDLDYYIKKAIYEGRHDRLKERLGHLAFFMAVMHKKTGLGKTLDLKPSGQYFEKLLGSLRKKRLLDDGAVRHFRKLKDRWCGRDYMHLDQEVIIHGDATPTNFIFPPEDGVVAIDLERMKPGDRVFDVGMVCGELKHAFMWRTGDKFASEPHIGHFLREYARHFGGDHRVYWSVVRRNPFYMAVTELRIARNSWLDRDHRMRLIREAGECLTWGLDLK